MFNPAGPPDHRPSRPLVSGVLRKIGAALLVSASLYAQSTAVPEYPLVLTVTDVQFSKTAPGHMTNVTGILSEDSWRQPVELTCSVALSSRGPDGKPNTYPARWGYNARATWPKPVIIYAREPGKPSMRDYKCSAHPLP